MKPTISDSGPLYLRTDRYKTTRSTAYQVSHHSHIMGCVEPVDWLPEELYWSGLKDVPTGLCEGHRDVLRDVDSSCLSDTVLGR